VSGPSSSRPATADGPTRPGRPGRLRAAAGLTGVAVSVLAVGTLLPPGRAARADPVRGERVFQRCYACHSIVAGGDNLAGPSLRCVLDRRAGTLPGFAFSPAMREAGARRDLVWTRPALDTFLEDPQRLVPGTAMSMPGLPEPEDRRDVIDYLARTGPCLPSPASRP
jgi:cytochrome c